MHDIVIVHAGSNSRLLSVRTKDLLNLLKQSYSSHKSKNVEFLITVEQLVHWLKGGRLTSCKSGKDRTSMSVTLEECSLLRTMHHLDNSAFNKTLSTLRRYVFSSLFPHAHKYYCIIMWHNNFHFLHVVMGQDLRTVIRILAIVATTSIRFSLCCYPSCWLHHPSPVEIQSSIIIHGHTCI